MGRLIQLPNELLSLIVEYCEFEDCKNLRATSKTFAPATNAKVFHTIYLALFPSFLDRFVSLSKDPELAKCVESVVFVGDILPEIESVQRYESLVDLRESWSTFSAKSIMRHQEEAAKCSKTWNTQDARHLAREEYEKMPRHELESAQIQEHYMKYNILRRQQYDLHWRNDVSEKFNGAFSRLPNLVSVRNTKYKFSDNKEKFPWKQLRRDILIGPDDWMRLHAVAVGEGHRNQGTDAFRGRIHMSHFDDLFVAVTKRSQDTQMKPLKSLQLTNVGFQVFFKDFEPLDPSCLASNLERSGGHQNPFEHLTRLVIDATYQTWGIIVGGVEVSASACVPDNIRWLVSQAASSLEELNLKCLEDDWDEQMRLGELNTLGNIKIPTLPRLRVLKLSCTMGAADLLDLLATHSQTLRCLELVDCNLQNGDNWTSTIADIPNMIRLDQVYLEGLQDEIWREGNMGYFEDGLDQTDDPHPHDYEVRGFILNGGIMPALDYDVWVRDRHNIALEMAWNKRKS